MARAIATDPSPEERVRFWANVKTRPGVLRCWDWKGMASDAGYGVFAIDGERVAAHRVAYAYAYGIDPGDRMVLHSCDREACNNPRHLRLGGPGDNGADQRVAAMMDRLHRALTGRRASVPVTAVEPRPRTGAPLSPERAWAKLSVPNDTALAIRFSFFAIGVRDFDALAAAHGVKPCSARDVVRRGRNREVPRVKGEPRPNGSCGHHRLSDFGIGAGAHDRRRRHNRTVVIPSIERTANHVADGSQCFAGVA